MKTVHGRQKVVRRAHKKRDAGQKRVRLASKRFNGRALPATCTQKSDLSLIVTESITRHCRPNINQLNAGACRDRAPLTGASDLRSSLQWRSSPRVLYSVFASVRLQYSSRGLEQKVWQVHVPNAAVIGARIVTLDFSAA